MHSVEGACTAEPELTVLGAPRLRGRLLPDERPTQLLVLLAACGGVLARAEAAQRLWPELPELARQGNLRKTLHRLRAGHGSALVDGEGTQLALCASTDLQALQAALDRGRPADALPLLRGPLAEGLHAAGPAPAWLEAARGQALARWRQVLLAALPALPPERAEAELVRLRALEPLDEPLLRAHLERLAADGRREAYLRERRAYEQRLQAAAGAPPATAASPATDAATDAGPAPADRAPPALATPADPARAFVGREDELEQLEPLLAQPGLVLLLRGPGGVGKTRLAGELARRAPARGLAVVWWPLAECADSAAALGRLAAELGAERADPGSLVAALQRRPALVVVDNAETLLDAEPGLAASLGQLFAAAPGVRWLITSRVAAAWPGCREHVLGGLEQPDPADPPGAVLRAPAVRLVVARARSLDAGFEPRAQAGALARLARALAGHPLALELAAVQLRTTAAETLAREAEAGRTPDDLAPLFEAGWRALPAAQQAALQRIAVLPHGLPRAALLAGAGLRPPALQALVLRSWLEREPATAPVHERAPERTGEPAPAAGRERWRLHPLQRAWLQEQHAADAATARAARHAAAEAVLAEHAALLAPGGTDRPGALDMLEIDLPLLRLALDDAVARADTARLRQLVPALAALFEQRGRRNEGLAWLADAAARLSSQALAARAPVQAARAMLSYRAGRLDEATLLARGLQRAAPRERATAARTLGLVHWQRGELAAAKAAFERAHALAVEHGFDDLVPDAINNLALVDQMAGRDAEAERRYREVARLARMRGSVRLQALALLNLGSLLHPAGQGRAARAVLHEALALMAAHGLHSLVPHAQLNLAGALFGIADTAAVAELRRLLAEAEATLPAGEGALRFSLRQAQALLHARHGDPAAAWPLLAEAWGQAVALGAVPQQLGLLPVAAQAWAAAGRRRPALAWLAWQRGQAQQWEADRREAERLWVLLRPGSEEAAAAAAEAAALDLAAFGHALHDEAAAAGGEPPAAA